MKGKKIVPIFLIIFIVIVIGGYFLIKYFSNKQEETSIEEYTPEEEISEDQARQTIVSLYFLEKETGKLTPEARLVDVKDIINIPYEKLFEMLKEGPKNDKLQRLIPEDTNLIKSYRENDCLVLDLSKDFLTFDFSNETNKNNLIASIVNTMTELTEVNTVKFLIEGKQNDNLKDVYARQKML